MSKHTKMHAMSGIKAKLPKIECIPNSHKDYEITIETFNGGNCWWQAGLCYNTKGN